MHILFIGGTRFVGRAMAAEALRRGHRVDLFHRGRIGTDTLSGAGHLLGDRMQELSALAEGRWDATVDVCGYRPGEVRRLAVALQGRGGRHAFVSSVSAYADDIAAHSDERARRAGTAVLQGRDPATIAIDGETYGPLKVLCEDAVLTEHRGALVLRPTYVIGPYDPTQRFAEWVRRLSAGGTVDAPEPRDEPIQVIDARDQAAFAIDALERGMSGTFNVAGPAQPITYGALLECIAEAVGPPGTKLRWHKVDDVESGAARFPMWGQASYSGVSSVDASAARAQGLRCRPVADSARDVLAWLHRSSRGS
jgi:2'-hydroxyisoflavone reductase